MTDRQRFDTLLTQRAQHVEEALEQLLPASSTYPEIIHEAMRYSALGGGKRLRGVLLMEAALLVGGRDTFQPGPSSETVELTSDTMAGVGAVRAGAAAVEMVHAYSLVHDDLPCMDDDDMRRGKASNHRVFGEGMAVLAGDALLTRAFEVVAHLPATGVSPEATVSVLAELTQAAGTDGLIGGQVADLQSEGALADGPGLEGLLEFIHSRKTGALFRASLRMGGFIAGADEDALDRLRTYSEGFGLAFQIVDDLLDVEGDAEALGKKVGSDERKGKLTFPALYGVSEARALAQEQISQAKEALAPFGRRAGFLMQLADFVLIREH